MSNAPRVGVEKGQLFLRSDKCRLQDGDFFEYLGAPRRVTRTYKCFDTAHEFYYVEYNGKEYQISDPETYLP